MQSEVAGGILHFVQTDAALPDKRRSRGFIKVGYIYFFPWSGNRISGTKWEVESKVAANCELNITLVGAH